MFKLTAKEEYEDLAEKFLSRIFNTQYSSYLSVLAQMALRINSSLQCIKESSCVFSFKSIVLEVLMKRFKTLTSEIDKRTAVTFFGELYNIDWISKATINAFINDLKESVYTKDDDDDTAHIFLIQSLLKVSGCKLAKQGSKEQLIEYRNLLKKSLKNNDNHVKFIAQDAINSLNNVIYHLETAEKLSKKQFDIEINEVLTIDNLYESISEEAYCMIITAIKKKPVKSTAELNSIVDKIIQKIITGNAIASKASNDLKDLSCENNSKFADILSKKCYEIFQEFLRDENKSSSLLRLTQFIGDLYNSDVLSNNFINICYEILFNTSPKVSIACIDVLTRQCGKKMELVNEKKLEFYFKYFEHIASTEKTYRAKVFTKLINLRKCDWIGQELALSYEDFLIQYSICNVTITDIIERLKHAEEMQKFIISLWTKILREPHPSYSELCLQIMNLIPEFFEKLSTFLTIRCTTFMNLDPNYWTEAVMDRYGQVVTFVSELYAKNAIADGLIEMWLNGANAEKIPTTILDTIIYNLNLTIGKSSNHKLKLLHLNLIHIADKRAQAENDSIKSGFCKLSSMLKDLQK
jgi:hypothetical protein